MKNQLVAVCLLLALAMPLASCTDQTLTSTKPATPENNNLRSITLTGKSTRFPDIQRSVKSRLEDLLTSGKYNVVSVSTYYTQGFLTAAEITYRKGVCGEGNGLRVMLFLSEQDHRAKKQGEVLPAFEQTANSGKFRIKNIKREFDGNFLVAAEIYYQAKPKGKR